MHIAVVLVLVLALDQPLETFSVGLKECVAGRKRVFGCSARLSSEMTAELRYQGSRYHSPALLKAEMMRGDV